MRLDVCEGKGHSSALQRAHTSAGQQGREDHVISWRYDLQAIQQLSSAYQPALHYTNIVGNLCKIVLRKAHDVAERLTHCVIIQRTIDVPKQPPCCPARSKDDQALSACCHRAVCTQQ